jgi:hypothetical protein
MWPLSLPIMSVILHGQGLDEWSARVFGLAEALKEGGSMELGGGGSRSALTPGDIRTEVRARLGEEAFARETEGRPAA